jgi:hypothetical protein
MDWKPVALASIILLALLSSFYLYKMSEEASVKELKILWPDLDEVSSRLCVVNSTYHYLESALLSCEGSCYSLVRYRIYFPTDDELEMSLPLQILRDGKVLLSTNVTAFKRNYTVFIQTVALLVKFPRGAEIKILNMSIRPDECLKSEIRPPQVIYTRGIIDDWILLKNGFRICKIFDDVYASTWRGNASLICGGIKVNLRNIEPTKWEIAIISLKGRCEVELNGERAPIGS